MEEEPQIEATTNITNKDLKYINSKAALFFGSVTSFKDLFNFNDDPTEIVVDFENSRVYDHSGLEAINNITEKYASLDKKLHLCNLSNECASLIKQGKNIVEVSVLETLEHHHLAEDSLG